MQQQNDNQTPVDFPRGLFFKEKHPNAPEYVIGKVKIKLDEAINWLQNKMREGEQWVTLDVKQSQKGKTYMSVNNWKPNNPAGQNIGYNQGNGYNQQQQQTLGGPQTPPPPPKQQYQQQGNQVPQWNDVSIDANDPF